MKTFDCPIVIHYGLLLHEGLGAAVGKARSDECRHQRSLWGQNETEFTVGPPTNGAVFQTCHILL